MPHSRDLFYANEFYSNNLEFLYKKLYRHSVYQIVTLNINLTNIMILQIFASEIIIFLS